MERPTPYVVEVEYFSKKPPREEGETVQEMVDRWCEAPTPFARLRFLTFNPLLVRKVNMCLATERICSRMCMRLNAIERNPKERTARRKLALQAAIFGNRARERRANALQACAEELKVAFEEYRDIAVHKEDSFFILSEIAAYSASLVLEHGIPSIVTVFLGGTLFAPEESGVLMLA